VNRDSRRLRIILALLVLTAFTLITLDYRSGKSGPFSSARSAVSDVFDPVESGLSHVFRPVDHFFADIGHAGRDGGRVRSLQQQVAVLQAQLREQGDVTTQDQQLSQLLQFSAAQRFEIRPAQVVALGDASGFDDEVTIDAGADEGVADAMSVIAGTTQGGGLVGRVVSVGPHSAIVAVVIDPDFKVASRLHGDDAVTHVGITTGHGLAPLTFTPTDPSVRPKRGQLLETYGTATYAAGIPIGTVTTVGATPGQTTLTAQVTPFIDYTGLDLVGVVLKPATGTAPRPVLPTVTVHATVTVTLTPTPHPTGGPTGGSVSLAPGVTPTGSSTTGKH
jgi:rod shape-determining protein MreC